ncbi:MAG: DNA-binding transcriptional regulator OxyR [Nitrospinae bacterium CG11_big_fil_rev_8_21_14_0_20_56_8]|nr:MAG: DNA-binding transcriptional regulator OxyR [Nitrospinae bacterium CG11_big_fil_rev_8_21_14_0_20_56_8]
MKSISLIQLSYLVAVFQHRNFGDAARACHVSQPTLSVQIQKLEEELGIIAFDRSRKPVEPTLIGRKIIQQAQNILLEVQRIEELIKTERGEIAGDFKLGIIPTLAPYLLPLFLKKFTQNFPRVNLILEELQTQQILEKLKEDKLDAGILVTPLNCQGIVERPLFYEPFIVYLTPGHPLHSLKKVSDKDLTLEDVWLLNEGHCFRDQAMEICKKVREKDSPKKNLVFESGNLETLMRLVDQNLGYTLVPYLSIREMPDSMQRKKLRFFKPPVPLREVSLVFCRSYLKQGIIEVLSKEITRCLPRNLQTRQGNGKIIKLTSFNRKNSS